ncbi:ATP-binding cassette domain-containing protein [Bilophila wadsworthia]|uniref:ATP-binding cassette domain-containing protein n=3 Tax=Bilophila wadsworthia TaxID=35833 RepID=UPI00242BC3FE|nr:ATP-binding cassette domain-containing protein [Bilophila wadsworthia]
MSPFPQAVIRLQGVSKVFPDVPPGTPPALSSLTADVPSGLVVGLVGPDAAGKTTLMRLLAGLLLPTSGSVEVLGRVPGSEASDEAVHDVGYMPQRFGLYEDLSVIDNLNLHAELRGLEGPARQSMFEKLLTFTALKPFTDRLAGKLSGGMKQKLGLACALLTTPRLLLLDEPGVGVDPLSRRELWKMVSELAVGGMSVLWSTAYMDEAERCAHVLMLDQGSLVYQGPPAGFTGRVAKRVFSFVPPSGEARAMLARWQQEPGIRDALIQGNRIRVVLRNPHDGPFSRKGVELHPVEPRLEDAYIDAVGGMDQRPSPFLPVSGRGGAEDPGEGRGNFSGERLSPSLPRTPSLPLPKIFTRGREAGGLSEGGAASRPSAESAGAGGSHAEENAKLSNPAVADASATEPSSASSPSGKHGNRDSISANVFGRGGMGARGKGGETFLEKSFLLPSPGGSTPHPAPAAQPVIRAVSLTKKFGTFVAAHDITFEVQPGRIFGLLGPNGAGKSTTFRMLCGLSRPTEGECFVAGMNLLTAGGAARAKLGYMAQKFSLYGELTVQQNMRLMADLYGLERGRVKPRIEQLVEALDLETFRDVRAFNLPLGQKQRLAMACATLHEPPVLFLDEPTSGVDPRTRREFWKHINAMTQNGVAVLVTTHFMEEAEYCDEIALVFQGGIIARGTPDELKGKAPGAAKNGGAADMTLEEAFIAYIEEVQRKGGHA